MNVDFSKYIARPPRHPAQQRETVHVELHRMAEHTPQRIPGELTDFSRHGAKLRVPDPLDHGEAVEFRLSLDGGPLRFAAGAHIRWTQEEAGGSWLVGCAFDEPAPWEVMGELFLADVLDRAPSEDRGE